MGKYSIAEPCYLELKPISLRFALLFSVIYYLLSWTQLSQTPYHILTSSVIYYWTDAWQLGIYLFYIIKNFKKF